MWCLPVFATRITTARHAPASYLAVSAPHHVLASSCGAYTVLSVGRPASFGFGALQSGES